MKSLYIMDTNVAKVADFDDSPQASLECQKRCYQFVEDIVINKKIRLILDTRWAVMGEYHDVIKKKGGIGEQLIRLLASTIGSEEYSLLLPITPQNGHDEGYAEFPNHDERLADFDRRDRKWIALARVYIQKYPDQPSPPIKQATDDKWHAFEAFFKDYGILIDWVCE